MVRPIARRVALAVGVAIAAAVVGIEQAGAQLEQSELDSQPASTETTQLVTSTSEVRQAVIGLLFVALVSLLVFLLYWVLTGRAARERFEREFGGRHATADAPRRRSRGAVQPSAAVRVDRQPSPPARRRSTPRPQEPVVAPGQVHPGWVDPSGRRRRPATVHPAWVDQGAPSALGGAMLARHAVPETRLPWQDTANDPADSRWPRPFEER